MSYRYSERRLNPVHLKYKQATGLDTPEFDRGEEIDYVLWLEEQLEKRLEIEQENIDIVSWKGQNTTQS